MKKRGRISLGEKEWRSIIEEQEGSGQRVAEYCEGKGISACRFYHWRKRLSKKKSRFIRIEGQIISSEKIVIETPDKYRIEIPERHSRELLEGLRQMVVSK